MTISRIWLLIALAFCMSCKVAAPTFSGMKFSGKPAEGNSKDLQLDVTIQNPNRFALKLKKVDLQITYNEKVIGRAYINKKVRIAGRGTQTAQVQVAMEKMDMSTMMVGFFSRKNEVQFTGKIKCAAGIIPKKIRVNAVMELNLKDLF